MPHDVAARSLELAPGATVRSEAFGGLVYHSRNRRLTLLGHPDLTRVLETLGECATVTAALDVCNVDGAVRPAFLRACSVLLDQGALRDSAR
jgi:putative mycofactocin binding protein MftB